MAQRRMFSNRIANSSRFLQMPIESQLLYFHFILRADDDGVVESYPIIKLLGMATDSFKVLVAKEFIKILNEDQVVVITDWLEHNVIRADRKVNSIYNHLLPLDIKTIEPQPRSDVEDNSKRLSGQSTDGIGKVRLGKVSEDKMPSEDGSIESILEEKGTIKHDFQFVGLDIFEKTNAPKDKRAECMRIAKKYPSFIQPSLTFCLDYPKQALKWKMFLWKLNTLIKENEINKTNTIS